MPNRILRDGILESEAVCSLSWASEVLYRRLMSVADDYGRFSAVPKLIRAKCYPLQIDKVSDADVGKWLTQVVEAGLVSVYPAEDGKRYLQINKFGQQVRAKSKYPEPPEGTCYQLLADSHQTPANAHLVGVEDGDVSVTPQPPKGGGLFDEFWSAYPRKAGKDAALKAFDKRKPDRALLELMLRAIDAASRTDQWRKDDGQFIPHPATWINQGRWQDEGVELPQSAAASSAADETARYLAEQAQRGAVPPPAALLARIRKPQELDA